MHDSAVLLPVPDLAEDSEQPAMGAIKNAATARRFLVLTLTTPGLPPPVARRRGLLQRTGYHSH
jgi:hypothetical protein